MPKFALNDRVMVAETGLSRQAEYAGRVTRIYDPPHEGFPQWYDVTDDDGTIETLIDESELTKF